MADVTDAAFRRIIARYGKPDVMWTEFVSADGLVATGATGRKVPVKAARGREKLLLDLSYTESERPIVAQLFGATPANFFESARLLKELGFDGIDINMGCPQKNVERQGAGAALIKNARLAQEIISETKRGAGHLPVSVKTRLGYNDDILEEWLGALLEAAPAAVTIHARTRREMSLVPARWEAVGRAVALVQARFGTKKERLVVIGNGDVRDLAEAEARARESGADGVMIGRGVFGNPWFFDRTRRTSPTPAERLRAMLEHTFLYEELFAGRKSFDLMKKHYAAYITGWRGARALRSRLMSARNAAQVAQFVRAEYPDI
ncbi:MAG TPA: tRNA-dihydrouridine synthase [Candidatus Paceibacterota bacterium]|nr:tRNA-dihydrouridine synthase [Candidatus Paceibacterota bacterium]